MTVTTPQTPGSGEAGRPVIRGWTAWAACRTPDMDPELFFPVGSTGPALLQIAKAKRICTGCAVRLSCLAWALSTGESAGIWGGTTPEERRMLRRA